MTIAIHRIAPRDVDIFRATRLAALADAPDAFGETHEEALASDWPARTALLFRTMPEDRAVFVAVADGDPIGIVFVRCSTEGEPAFLGSLGSPPATR